MNTFNSWNIFGKRLPSTFFAIMGRDMNIFFLVIICTIYSSLTLIISNKFMMSVLNGTMAFTAQSSPMLSGPILNVVT